MIPQKQLSLADIFEDCKNIYESDKPHFLTLLENHIDLDKIIPTSFYKSHLKSNLPTMKFVCPKIKWEYNREDKSKRRVCHYDNPCTTSSCGRMIYVYPEKNLRAYPGVDRGSQEWDDTYKIRVNVEKSINGNTSEV